MQAATFELDLSESQAGPSGADRVEFLLAANPGVPPAPLREIASGGELSRVMLAIMGAVAEAEGRGGYSAGGEEARAGKVDLVEASDASNAVPEPVLPTLSTLVFDEVDAGVGGRTAQAVGDALLALAGSHQLLCITHLPQIAAKADRHFSIEKDVDVSPARTTVRHLGAEELVAELVRMLGAEGDDAAARRHAKKLLAVSK
jgi:DNA repair protein RecN (Recombination protein N)